MAWRNDPQRWGWVAQALHWSIALLIIGLAVVGWWMQDMPNSLLKLKVFAWHKSFGITVLALVCLRLLWRLYDRRPEHPDLPRWQLGFASLVHGLLYVLMLWMPLTGWLYNSASNFPLRWFGLFVIPALSGPDPEWKLIAHEMHRYGFYLLGALFTLHAGAAMHHHLIKRNDVLRRMLPIRRPPNEAKT